MLSVAFADKFPFIISTYMCASGCKEMHMYGRTSRMPSIWITLDILDWVKLDACWSAVVQLMYMLGRINYCAVGI